MNPITVSCLKSDPLALGVQKYDNAEPWNVAGGGAPNGVSATRYLRRTSPDASALSPLAGWLVENLSGCVAGRTKHRTGNLRCEGRETEFRALVREFSPGGWRHSSGLWGKHRTPEQRAKSFEAMYGEEFMNSPTVIESWLFPQILPRESDTDYWNRVAHEIAAAGTARVSVDGGPQFVVAP